MHENELRELLEGVQSGRLSVDAALARVAGGAVADMGFAHLDLHRRQRCGFPEVIFGEGKTPEQVEGLVRRLLEARQDCLATRVSPAQADHLARHFPQAEQDRVGRTFWLPAAGAEPRPTTGKVFVLTAGTSDLPVAQEAVNTARALGADVKLVADVGVAGIHRLLGHRELVMDAKVVVCVAGMEGALASVIGGLVRRPVIAVPTSVGYGANFEGLATLLAMLNSCASGVTTVNIDNGFGAGYSAALIARG